MLLGRYARWTGAGLMAAAATALSLAVPAQASPAAGVPPPAGAVRSEPPSTTPHLSDTVKLNEQIRDLAECDGVMYAVGTFGTIYQGSTKYSMENIFRFSASGPDYQMSTWSPKVNGEINTIAFSGGQCAHAYIGGRFTKIGSTTAKNIAEINTTGPTVVTGFKDTANGQVETIMPYQNHLIVGGYFTAINGSSKDPYLVSLSPVSGNNDGFIDTDISGHYSFKGVAANPTRIYNQALSSGGSLDVMMGDFTSAGHQPRQQMFMLNLGSRPHPTVTGWDPWQFNKPCSPVEPFYGQAASWAPNGKTIYVADTGTKTNGTSVHSLRTGLCDAAAAFPTNWAKVQTAWINYTGCDSLYATAADSSAVYFGGHERWASNRNGCNAAGAGAVVANGMAGMSPGTGSGSGRPFTVGGSGYYYRDRGYGADDMLITGAGTGNGQGGLWVASDNFEESNVCGNPTHVHNLAGICFLPYS